MLALVERIKYMPQFLVIGAPYFIGKQIAGRNEVAEIIASGFVEKIGADYLEIQPDFATHTDPVIAVNISLAAIIADHPNHFPIVLSGDCVNSLGMVKGLRAQQEVGIIWYDAHGDFNTPETSPSGFLGGMPLATLVGQGNDHLREALSLEPLNEEMIIFTDGRDLDPEEGVNIRASNITIYEDVKQLMTAPMPAYPVYVHLDVDIVDPEFMPALGYPAENGPSPNDVADTLKLIGREAQVEGLLVSLWNGDQAADETPLQSTLTMVNALLDGLIS